MSGHTRTGNLPFANVRFVRRYGHSWLKNAARSIKVCFDGPLRHCCRMLEVDLGPSATIVGTKGLDGCRGPQRTLTFQMRLRVRI